MGYDELVQIAYMIRVAGLTLQEIEAFALIAGEAMRNSNRLAIPAGKLPGDDLEALIAHGLVDFRGGVVYVTNYGWYLLNDVVMAEPPERGQQRTKTPLDVLFVG